MRSGLLTMNFSTWIKLKACGGQASGARSQEPDRIGHDLRGACFEPDFACGSMVLYRVCFPFLRFQAQKWKTKNRKVPLCRRLETLSA
jgi:hypothetical protein